MTEIVIITEGDVRDAVDRDLAGTLDSLLAELLSGTTRPSYRIETCTSVEMAVLQPLVQEACQDGAKVFIGVGGVAARIPEALAACNGQAKVVISVPVEGPGPVLTGLSILKTEPAEGEGLTAAAYAAWRILASAGHDLELALLSRLARTTE